MEDNVPYGNLIRAMKQQSEEDKIFMQEVALAFEDLNLHNSIYAQELVKLARTLRCYSIESVDDPAAELELDRDRGLSINVGTAIRALDHYAKPLRKDGEKLIHLDIALVSLFREKERRILNEI